MVADAEADPLDAESVELGRQVVRALMQQRDHRPSAAPLPDPAQLQDQARRTLGGEGAEDDKDPPSVRAHDGWRAMREIASDLAARCHAS